MVPSEWATTASAGPKRQNTASSALANSTPLVRRGPEGPWSESPCAGLSNSTTRRPVLTSGSTSAPNWDPRPPHPCTRYTVPGSFPRRSKGRGVQTCPRTTWPSAWTSNGCPPSGTGRSAIRGGVANHRSRARRPAGRGATYPPYRRNERRVAFLIRTIVLFRRPDNVSSSPGDGQAALEAMSWPSAWRVCSRALGSRSSRVAWW